MSCFVTKIKRFDDEKVISSLNIFIFNDDDKIFILIMTSYASQKVLNLVTMTLIVTVGSIFSDDNYICHIYLLRCTCCDDPCDDKMASPNSLDDKN